ncbi:MAG: glutathione S-transferase family protein [Acidobacteria bacterium]|nr:glutathione S-transferase family protein [Acidobacteriota bacterium]
MLQLFGSFTSPFVRHCRIALLEQELPFEMVETDYLQSALGSPTKRVPFLKDKKLFLSDSLAILFEIRARAKRPVFRSSEEAETFCLATTLLDTGINLFLLSKEGLGPADSKYLERQTARMESGFAALEDRIQKDGAWSDATIRTACLLKWVNYRKRFDFSHLPHLTALHEQIEYDPLFQQTAPPPL